MAVVAHFQHLASDVHADFLNHAQYIALGDWRVRAHHKIGAAEGVKVGGMVGGVKDAVKHLAQLFGSGGRIHLEKGVERLG